MKESYIDILDRINETPTWWDANGTPRYGPFTPQRCPNIYSRQVVLLAIVCQYCNQRFDVELHAGVFTPIRHPKKLHYGDPPAHGCVGDTMNCYDREVLEVWYREPTGEWKRKPELEGRME
jgi:hypothetical protein